MAMSEWNPFRDNDDEMPARRRESNDPFRQLQNEMNRVFENFFDRSSSMMRRGGGRSGEMSRPNRESGQQQMSRRFSPRVDMSEDAESLKVRAELPGMTKDDIELYADEEGLTIKGQKQHEETTEDEGFYRRERSYGYFQRTVPFPVGVDTDNANAEFRDGVLNVRLPKTGESKGKQLEIE